MAIRHRELPRLNIPAPPHMRPPMLFDGREQVMFSPGLPTALQASFHPQFNHTPLQTPMHPFFTPPFPGGPPGRPTHMHQAHPSVAQLAAIGVHPPNGLPNPPAPLGHPSVPSMMMGGGPGFPHNSRNRRTTSMSIGGPPKAVLGGPARKPSPIPPAAVNPPAPGPVPPVKKMTVNLPRETILGENGQPATHPTWARLPLAPPPNSVSCDLAPRELTSAEVYPPDAWKHTVPDTIDVFLPGKSAWDAVKHRAIEEKLESLGVERGERHSAPRLLGPHPRAASISSPADPALLFFKLNKLQQAQTTSAGNSSTIYPPPLHLSPSPNFRFQNRHNYTMSLAPQSSIQPSTHYNPTAAFNPFGPNAVLGSDQIVEPNPVDGIHAPQGRAPVAFPSLSVPNGGPQSRPSSRDSRPDFTRGFGLDIPEEDETEAQTAAEEHSPVSNVVEEGSDLTAEQRDDSTTPAQSAHHSRHVSQLSAAFASQSLGGRQVESSSNGHLHASISPHIDGGNAGGDDEAVGEWTGSEDLRAGSEASEDESIGEWSNPSDEERARQQRVSRRQLQRTAGTEGPRRLPKFPQPPDNTFAVAKTDDTISNPSEEGVPRMATYHNQPGVYLSPNAVDRSLRLLPPLPHSRLPSGHYSGRSSGYGHLEGSQSGSSFVDVSAGTPLASAFRTDILNPFAKPFIFGGHLSGSWAPPATSTPPQPEATPLSHSRTASFAKPLNAAASEFKPGAFNFQLPPGVPQLTFPAPVPAAPAAPRPLPSLPTEQPGKPQQGREKRQRRGSSSAMASEDYMASFRFPKPQSDTQASPPSGIETLPNEAAPHVQSSGVSDSTPIVRDSLESRPSDDDSNSPDAFFSEDQQEKEDSHIELPKPPSFKPKRAPMPLDFTHPVSNNTVPAGLFKALISGGDARSIRSRMNSRDLSEHLHRPSLDDFKVPAIARQAARDVQPKSAGMDGFPQVPEDLNSPEQQQRVPSIPSHLRSQSGSGISIPAVELQRGIDMRDYERRLEALLDEKLEVIRRELIESKEESGNNTITASTEAMIADVLSLFRAQLQEFAVRSLEDSEMDARGELDFELIKGILEQGHAENRALLCQELNGIVDRLASLNISSSGPSADVVASVESLSNRTVSAVVGAVARLSGHLEQVDHLRSLSGLDQNMLLRDLMDGLTPAIASLRSEPIDYEYLTAHLTQAVKPHISQLIDLASDKRETAELIIDRLIPLLPRASGTLDTDTVIAQLTTEIRRAIAPIDVFEIKEQVADLVVERLDSRLAVRERTLNVDTIAGKVTESVVRLLEPFQQVSDTASGIAVDQKTLVAKRADLSSAQADLVSQLSSLPAEVTAATHALQIIQAELRSRPVLESSSNETMSQVKSHLDDFATSQRTLARQNEGLLSLHNDILQRVKALPEAFAAATAVLQAAQASSILSRDGSHRELDDLKKANGELQVQLAKARGAHGQVRVEKESACDRLRVAENERERLRNQIHELQVSANDHATKLAEAEKTNRDLDDALKQALARLQAADVTAQASQERIEQLQSANNSLVPDKQSLRSQVDKLEMQLTFANRDHESVTQAFSTLQRQHDTLVSQQDRWDELHRATQQMEALSSRLNHADDEEMKELRRIRDRHRILETEYAALQKRVREQDTKIVNNERALLTARQSLTAANQRSAEWERRAKESEGKYDMTQTQLDQLEQTHAQLEADHTLARLQLEEKEAEERLLKDRESRLREQVSTLETRVTRLQSEVGNLRGSSPAAVPSAYRKGATNGHSAYHSTRPDSRSSAVFVSRSGTPVARSETPPAHGGVWESMHAPKSGYMPLSTPPRTRHATKSYHNAQAPPSPTPSTVSLAPTQGEDGWWQ